MMLASLAAAFALLVAPLPGHEAPVPEGVRAAADSLVGAVTDEGGRPVAGAIVSIAELRRTTRTDASGTFRLAAVPAGRYTVTVGAVGFAPWVEPVEMGAAVRLSVRLTPSPFHIEPIVVTSTRGPTEALETPLATATLSADALRRNQSVSIAHAIENLAGVRTLSTGAQIGKPVIRGLTGSRVLVLEDGNRLEDYSWSDEDGPSIDAGLTERIEVIRGPASVLYGSDALNGVVNALPTPVPDATGTNPFTRGTVELYGASNNFETGVGGSVAHASGGFGYRIGGIFRRASSLQTPTGELDNTGFTALNGDAALGIRGQRGSWAVRLAHYGGEFRLLEANAPPPGTTEGEEGPVRKALDDRLQFSGERLFSSWRLEGKAQFQRHSLIEVSDDANPEPGAAKETTAFDLLLNTLSADVVAHFTGPDRFRASVGLNGMTQSNDSRGPIPLVPDASSASAAVFGLGEYRLQHVSFHAGARFDTRSLDSQESPELGLAAESRHYDAFSGNLGVVLRPGEDVAVTANLGRGWRAPNLFELFANGPHLGEARYELGDPDLGTERSTNVDASVRWQARTVRAELTGYRNSVAGYIYITPTTDTIAGLPVYQHVQADAVLIGGEASLEVDVASSVTLSGRLDGVRATNQETDTPLPLTPPLRTVIGAEFHRSHLSWADRFQVAAEVQAVAEQTRLDPLDVPTDGYALVNLRAGVEHPFLGRETRFDLGIHNLLDTEYRDFLSRYKAFALNPGRDVTIRLSMEL